MTLDELKPGSKGRMADLTATGALGQRLMDLGFCPGAEIAVVRNAPLEDPLKIVLDGAQVTLRHAEAKHIVMEA